MQASQLLSLGCLIFGLLAHEKGKIAWVKIESVMDASVKGHVSCYEAENELNWAKWSFWSQLQPILFGSGIGVLLNGWLFQF